MQINVPPQTYRNNQFVYFQVVDTLSKERN